MSKKKKRRRAPGSNVTGDRPFKIQIQTRSGETFQDTVMGRRRGKTFNKLIEEYWESCDYDEGKDIREYISRGWRGLTPGRRISHVVMWLRGTSRSKNYKAYTPSIRYELNNAPVSHTAYFFHPRWPLPQEVET